MAGHQFDCLFRIGFGRGLALRSYRPWGSWTDIRAVAQNLHDVKFAYYIDDVFFIVSNGSPLRNAARLVRCIGNGRHNPDLHDLPPLLGPSVTHRGVNPAAYLLLQQGKLAANRLDQHTSSPVFS